MESPEINHLPVQEPISEDQDSVSYLGVRLEKSHVESSLIPRKENYADYDNDEFSLKLQQKIAVCLETGDPILIEGGTSLGKTTTVRKMAADLGWEVYYVNLTGATDVEDLMGRYVPNINRKNPEDPEFVFADGKVTAGLRKEEGKTKIIILDELNATPPNILIRLHEVLDTLERGGEVILSEDASEAVPVSKGKTKLVGLMNPPGKSYLGKETLDPAQLRRWVYQKEVSTLPKSTFEHSTMFLFGLDPQIEELPAETYIHSQDQALTSEQLSEIPGILEILAKYREFHQAANEMLKNRHLAQDQPQPFFFDDRMEPRRVRDFIQRFFNGDINETFQKALGYYYGGKLEGREDRQKLNELISHVFYTPAIESHRRALDMENEPEPVVTPDSSPRPIFSSRERLDIGEALRLAKEAIGAENFFGPDEIEATFGRRLSEHEIPPIPFSNHDLEVAKSLNQILVLRIDKAADGELLTMKKIDSLIQPKMSASGGGELLFNTDGYKDESFFAEEDPQQRWALSSREVVENSTRKNYLEQTKDLIKYLKEKVFAGATLPPRYFRAVKEFEEQEPEIVRLMSSDWETAAERLHELSITGIVRPTAVEALYDMVLEYMKSGSRMLENKHTWTSSRESSGSLVCLGRFGPRGARVGGNGSGNFAGDLGASFSRSM